MRAGALRKEHGKLRATTAWRKLSFEDYVRLDLDYVDGWSVVGDLVLLARTVPAVLRQTGV